MYSYQELETHVKNLIQPPPGVDPRSGQIASASPVNFDADKYPMSSLLMERGPTGWPEYEGDPTEVDDAVRATQNVNPLVQDTLYDCRTAKKVLAIVKAIGPFSSFFGAPRWRGVDINALRITVWTCDSDDPRTLRKFYNRTIDRLMKRKNMVRTIPKTAKVCR